MTKIDFTFRTRDGRFNILLAVSLALIVLAGGGWMASLERHVTPPEDRFGWQPEAAKVEAPKLAAMCPKFELRDDTGTSITGEGKSAELWRFVRLANDGKHVPCWKQETGDCCSMAATTAETVRQGVQIAMDGRKETLKIPFPPHNYGGSRVIEGRGQFGRQPGSTASLSARFAQTGGIYTLEQALKDGYQYKGTLADLWGRIGPPKATLEFSRKFRVRTISRVESAADGRDGLVAGYPFTIASTVGFDGGRFDADGKRWMKEGGRWPHSMCVIGVEDRPGRKKGFCIQQSWGADWNTPIDDSPPGSFWAEWNAIEKVIAQGDSWFYSDLDGFPAAPNKLADWDAFKEQVADDVTPHELARAETPEPQPIFAEERKTWLDPTCGKIILGLGCLGCLAVALQKLRSRSSAL